MGNTNATVSKTVIKDHSSIQVRTS